MIGTTGVTEMASVADVRVPMSEAIEETATDTTRGRGTIEAGGRGLTSAAVATAVGRAQSLLPTTQTGSVISGPVAPAATTATFGGAASQQATRHARRIYVGGLPPSVSEEALTDFISNALAAVGGTTAGPGSCVLNNYVNYEKRFAFIELRTVEETSNAMALDGIMFEGVAVRVRRPADYNPASAASLGPSVPNPNLNLAAIGLDKRQEAAAAPGAGAPGSVPG
ncbi:hypothetical protein H632_c347p0, partial [Helicosporidium sp. ATCC 50920]